MRLKGRRLSAPRFAATLLGSTILAGLPASALAQDNDGPLPSTETSAAVEAEPVAAPAQPAEYRIRSIVVVGSERLEPQTILSYIQLRVGDTYTDSAGDQALKDLYATELFADVQVRHEGGDVTIQVQENPIVNRIILEGNKRIKDDKIFPEINLSPRQIFTRSKVRADVARIIELYKRQGRFAAVVEPKSVALPQNRVDIVYEISEGPKSKVRQINIIGNEAFSDGDLRNEMVTKQARFFRLFSSSTSYDPDRLAYDQQKLRQFYLTEGYADFRVVSAVAELTPDKRDFIITYVVEEGERYRFGKVEVESQIRDFDGELLAQQLAVREGNWYDAKLVEDTVEQLTEAAGTFGYAFADVSPQFSRNPAALTMDIRFVINEAPRVYVEAVNVNGNTLTQDKVVRREFRIAEGDAFNSLAVRRSTNRINSLGYFQENFEIEQSQGSAPDRIVLDANVQEQPTGELQLSAGFSSLESFILQGSIRQGNFRGRGQTIGASVNYSRYSRSFNLSFVEPYVWDRNFSFGVDLYRRDLNNWNYYSSNRNTTFEQSTTGFSLRTGVPLTEYMSLIGRYTFNIDNIKVDENLYYSDRVTPNVFECDPLRAGRYLCDAIGENTSSILGLSWVYNTLDSRVRPTRGTNVVATGEFAGLGGSVSYLRLRANADKYFSLGSGFIFSLSAEGGYILGFKDRGEGEDKVRLTDRFFLGDPQIRGFDIRGVGPRIIREFPWIDPEDPDSDPVYAPINPFNPDASSDDIRDDPLGGTAYYLATAELEIPLGTSVRELGLRPSIFIDAGAVFNVTEPILIESPYPDGIFIPTRNQNGEALYTQINVATLVTPTGGGDPVCTPGTAAGDITTVTNPINPMPPSCLTSANNIPIGSSVAPFRERFVGDTPKPRIAIGIGVNWNSPFGPFRIDFAHVITKAEGDDTKAFTFNVGTQF
ncbi:MAG TPA: outer membrane protein assembly factor BamA [Sphingomonadaceae bacterium]|nr:outer membrane protein assembly factor BamA [Sphingomonadaceae bacterium]